MAKKETTPISNSIKTEGNNNSISTHIGDNYFTEKDKKEKKPHWLVKAVVLTILGIIAALVIFFVESAGNHSEPVHNDPPAILPNK